METTNDKLIRLRDVIEITTLRKTKIYDYIKKGIFPKQTKIGGSSVWSYNEVQDWIAQQLNK